MTNYLMRPRWVHAAVLPPDVRGMAEVELERATHAPGWHVRAKRIRRELQLLDVCAKREGGLHSIKVGLVRDHPASKRDGCPGKLAKLLKGSVRLAMGRADDAGPVLEWMDKIAEQERKWRHVR